MSSTAWVRTLVDSLCKRADHKFWITARETQIGKLLAHRILFQGSSRGCCPRRMNSKFFRNFPQELSPWFRSMRICIRARKQLSDTWQMSFDIYGVDTIFNDSVPGIQDRHFRLTTYHNWAPDLVATFPESAHSCNWRVWGTRSLFQISSLPTLGCGARHQCLRSRYFRLSLALLAPSSKVLVDLHRPSTLVFRVVPPLALLGLVGDLLMFAITLLGGELMVWGLC